MRWRKKSIFLRLVVRSFSGSFLNDARKDDDQLHNEMRYRDKRIYRLMWASRTSTHVSQSRASNWNWESSWRMHLKKRKRVPYGREMQLRAPSVFLGGPSAETEERYSPDYESWFEQITPFCLSGAWIKGTYEHVGLASQSYTYIS